MAWKCYHLTYELLSPLHIGYHKVGNLQRTRYYIPARNLWGATTEALTRRGFGESVLGASGVKGYAAVGKWVQEHCAFGYYFVCDGDKLLYPRYTQDGLCYGTFTQAEFERRYLGSHVATALDVATTSAQTGSLHEVEFLAPHDSDGQRTHLSSWVFLDEQAAERLGDEEKWRVWLGDLQIGGERRYGFGRLRMADNGWEEVSAMAGYPLRLDGERPRVQVAKGQPLLAHTLAHGVQARGEIEPLVGRETRGQDSRGFGRTLTQARICWAPGSVVEQDTWFTLEPEGIWRGDA